MIKTNLIQVRLDDVHAALLRKLAVKLDLDKSKVMRRALRELARRELNKND